MNSTPIPRASVPVWRRTCAPPLASIWPHARRRARRSGATGRHEVRERATGQERALAERQRDCNGRCTSCTSALDPLPIARQKKSVAAVPNALPTGTRKALIAPALRPRDRLRPLRLQVRAGRAVEEGRLELAPAPLEADPRELARRRRGSLGIVSTAGRRSSCGPRCRRSRRPARPDAPRYSAVAKKFACEPAAGYTTGCVPSTSSSLSSPRSPSPRPRAGCSRPRPASARAPRAAVAASKSSWIISQSPSCRLFQSL